MTAPNAVALLNAWEQAASQVPVRRALTLLAAACPEKTAEEWAAVPIGERDRQLLAVREKLFGTHLEALATCPDCGERLELNFKTDDIRTPPPAPCEEVKVCADGYEVRCRLPASSDLLEAARPDVADARAVLLQRCVTLARQEDAPVEPTALPRQVLDAVMAAVADADPQAEVRIAMDCPACRHRWSMDFDVLSYLWSEVDDWAPRLLRDVHALARAYGWSERDILALSATRRGLYLEMVAEDGF
jgi:hypothetical protein